MALTPGTRFGPYEVVAQIGAGGMGEVYRASDTKLGREVAIKVLPDAFARDTERLARFDREARTLARLNHPGIAQIYGVEDLHSTGAAQGGSKALVMELVEGPTLADRIAQGPIPIDEALPIATQIAEALESAHEQGIIHRDLKPANVKVRSDGTVKVLDFGLAKAMEPTCVPSPGLTQSPTITTPAVTQAGVILGTAAYMSPEQARGKTVDQRADIWAFGCVLFEMLTGRRAFEGSGVSDTLAAILRSELDWSALPADTPRTVQRLLRRCVEKEARQRWQAIGDVRLEIEEERTDLGSAAAVAATSGFDSRTVALWALAAAVAVLSVAVAAIAWRAPSTAPDQSPRRFVITGEQGPHEKLGGTTSGYDLAFSPGGGQLVYVATNGEIPELFVRPLDAFGAVAIPGTQGAYEPFFSPDGRWLAFFEGTTLKRLRFPDGQPLPVVEAGSNVAGATWGPGDTIIFGRRELGLATVSADVGDVKALTMPDPDRGETEHNWPEALPGGRGVLFTVLRGPDLANARVALLELDTGEWRELLDGEGYNARYASSGYLVYGRAGVVMAVPFDLDRLAIQGAPAQVLDPVQTRIAGGQLFAVSADGSLAYLPEVGAERELVWVDRNGRMDPVGAPPRRFNEPRVSPDGQTVAVIIDREVWFYDLKRGSLTALSRGRGAVNSLAWSSDGTGLTFEQGYSRVFTTTIPGGDTELRWETDRQVRVSDWSADAGSILLRRLSGDTGLDLWSLPLDDADAAPFVVEANEETVPMFSPDGRFVVYESDESGRPEVYVRTFPEAGNRVPVSTNGGTDPIWSRTGEELLYRNGDRILSVAIKRSGDLDFSPPEELFRGTFVQLGFDSRDLGFDSRDYDYDTHSRRFLMMRPAGRVPAPQINVVLNWAQELANLVPVD